MDAFYSGSSDVTLPARGERAEINLSTPPGAVGPEIGGPYFCERCDQSVPSHDLAAGRALSIYGLTFCAACRPAVEAERFEIHFCDECGVSIPLSVVEGGEAVLGDGRLVCARCARRPQRIVRRLRPIAWVGLVTVVLALVVVLALGWSGDRRRRREAAARRAALIPKIESLRDAANADLDAIGREVEALRDAPRSAITPADVDDRLAELDRRVRAWRDRIDAELRALERR